MTSSQEAGTATERITVRTEEELIRAVREADAAKTSLRLVAPGAPTPEGFRGQVIEVATRGMIINDDGCDDMAYCGGVQVTIAAGEDWPGFVALAAEREWVGIERLAGCAGTIGEVTVANPEAFGRSVGDAVAAVRTWDRATDAHRRFAMIDCGFIENGSRFGEELPDGSPRYVLLDVAFLFRQGNLTDPIDDKGLTELLGLAIGQRATLPEVVRAATP